MKTTSKLERPLHIPFAKLFDKRNFTRNVLIFKLWNDGLTQIEISKRMNLSKNVVSRVLNQYQSSNHYYQDNKERITIQRKERYYSDIEATRERNRELYAINADEKRAYNRKYHHVHKDEINSKKRQYHYENKEQINARKRAYHHTNKDQIRERKRLYYQEHPEKQLIKRNRRRAYEASAFIGYIPESIKEILYKKQEGLCIGCNLPLEDDIITLDHKIPLATERSIDCICNLQLMHKSCNSSKMAKILPEYEELNQLSLQLNQIRR